MAIITKQKQLKPILIDILNWLKSKKYIHTYESLGSLDDWPRFLLTLHFGEESSILTIRFAKSNRIGWKDLFCNSLSSKIDVYFNATTKEDLEKMLVKEIEVRKQKNQKQAGFESVLKVMHKHGFIQEYTKPSKSEQLKNIHWYITRKGLRVGITICASTEQYSKSKNRSNVLNVVFNNNTSVDYSIKGMKRLINNHIEAMSLST